MRLLISLNYITEKVQDLVHMKGDSKALLLLLAPLPFTNSLPNLQADVKLLIRYTDLDYIAEKAQNLDHINRTP